MSSVVCDRLINLFEIYFNNRSTYISTVFASSGSELEVGVRRKMGELGFSSTRFLSCINDFFHNLARAGPGSLEGETSLRP